MAAEITTPINSIPDEIIATVFSHLECRDWLACRQVSSRWKRIVDGEDLVRWRKLCLLRGYSDRDMELFCEETKRETWLEMNLFEENWSTGNCIVTKIDSPRFDWDVRVRFLRLVNSTIFIFLHEKVLIYDTTGELKNELQLPDGINVLGSVCADKCYLLIQLHTGILCIYKKTGAYSYELKCGLILKEGESEDKWDQRLPGVGKHLVSDSYHIYQSLDADLTATSDHEHVRVRQLSGDKLFIEIPFAMMSHIICLTTDILYCLPAERSKGNAFKWPLYCSYYGDTITVYNILDNLIVCKLNIPVRYLYCKVSIHDKCLAFATFNDEAVSLQIWNRTNWENLFTVRENFKGTFFHYLVKSDFVFLIFNDEITVHDYVKGEKLNNFSLVDPKISMYEMFKQIFDKVHPHSLLFTMPTWTNFDVWDVFSGTRIGQYQTFFEQFYLDFPNIDSNFQFFVFVPKNEPYVYILDFGASAINKSLITTKS